MLMVMARMNLPADGEGSHTRSLSHSASHSFAFRMSFGARILDDRRCYAA
jgi:hypothetical protein